MSTRLDFGQVIKQSFDETNDALQVRSLGSSLVSEVYDEIVLTYVPSGAGAGEIATATYKLATVTVATLTFSYNASNQLTSIVKS